MQILVSLRSTGVSFDDILKMAAGVLMISALEWG